MSSQATRQNSEVMTRMCLSAVPSQLMVAESEKSLSRVPLCDPMDCSPQAPLSTGFSRQEYWSGSSSSSPRDLPNPGIEPGSPAQEADSLPSE